MRYKTTLPQMYQIIEDIRALHYAAMDDHELELVSEAVWEVPAPDEGFAQARQECAERLRFAGSDEARIVAALDAFAAYAKQRVLDEAQKVRDDFDARLARFKAENREDNPSNAVIGRRKAALWAIIHKALEMAPEGVNRAVVVKVLEPLVEQLANPPKAAKVKPEKVKPVKQLKDGQLGEPQTRTVVVPAVDPFRLRAFREVTGSEGDQHGDVTTFKVQLRPIGFSLSRRQIGVADFSKVEALPRGAARFYAFDEGSGIPILQADTRPRLIKDLTGRWTDRRKWVDTDALFAAIGSVEQVASRKWADTEQLWINDFDRQELRVAENALVDGFKSLSHFEEFLAAEEGRERAYGLPMVQEDTSIVDALFFLQDYALDLAHKHNRHKDKEGPDGFEAHEKFAEVRAYLGEVAGRHKSNFLDYFKHSAFIPFLRKAQQRVQVYLWFSSDTLAFDAWKAEREAEEQHRLQRKADAAARHEKWKADEQERLAKPEERAFDTLFQSAAYEPHLKGGTKLYHAAWKLLGGTRTSWESSWFNRFRKATIELRGVKGETYVNAPFIEAARELRALHAEVSKAPEPNPDAYRMVSFDLPGLYNAQGVPVRGSVKAKPSELMFYLLDYLRFWNEIAPWQAEQQLEECHEKLHEAGVLVTEMLTKISEWFGEKYGDLTMPTFPSDALMEDVFGYFAFLLKYRALTEFDQSKWRLPVSEAMTEYPRNKLRMAQECLEKVGDFKTLELSRRFDTLLFQALDLHWSIADVGCEWSSKLEPTFEQVMSGAVTLPTQAHPEQQHDLHLTREENPARERVEGSADLIGQKVTVYRNLHLDTFSVRLGTKVVLHSDWVKLRDAKFVVQPGGRDTVRRTKAKLVHAYIGGILEDFAGEGEAPAAPTLPHPIGYNPYLDDTFVARDSGEAVFTAAEVELLGTRAYARGLNGRAENPASSGLGGWGFLAGAALGAFAVHRMVKR